MWDTSGQCIYCRTSVHGMGPIEDQTGIIPVQPQILSLLPAAAFIWCTCAYLVDRFWQRAPLLACCQRICSGPNRQAGASILGVSLGIKFYFHSQLADNWGGGQMIWTGVSFQMLFQFSFIIHLQFNSNDFETFCIYLQSTYTFSFVIIP